MMTRDPAEVCRLAQNLARFCGYYVFPCRLVIRPNGKADKLPARPKHQGGEGYRDASRNPDEINWLWQHWPGDLIGIATGTYSGISVLDADRQHATARAWWRVNHERLPPTRTFDTYSAGLHLCFQHRDGITNTQAKLCPGIDTRGTGGYVISWFAYGLECVDHTPPAPFPDWLHAELTYTPPPSPLRAATAGATARRESDPDAAIDGVLRFLAAAREGNRNGSLFWAACRLIDHGCGHNRAIAELLPIATAIGLSESEARRTIASAQRQEPRRRAA
jgi:hypothetical protein